MGARMRKAQEDSRLLGLLRAAAVVSLIRHFDLCADRESDETDVFDVRGYADYRTLVVNKVR